MQKEKKENFILVRMEPCLYNQIYVISSKEEISMAAFVRKAVKNFISNSKTK